MELEVVSGIFETNSVFAISLSRESLLDGVRIERRSERETGQLFISIGELIIEENEKWSIRAGVESVEITFEILDEERESIQIHEYQSRNRV